MQLQGRNLTQGMTGPDVQLLQEELQQLDFVIEVAEINETRFGQTTRRSVREFQKKHGLPITGEVDEPTARRINAEVDAAQPKEFSVGGVVSLGDGRPFADAIVRAFDRDLRSEELLGETTTNSAGFKGANPTSTLTRPASMSACVVVSLSHLTKNACVGVAP